MTLKHIDEYRDSELSKSLLQKIKTISKKDVRLMEVCGTHTVSIFRSGIRSVLPQTISLLSGPGCPVCVTDQAEIDAFIELARIRRAPQAGTFGSFIQPLTLLKLQKKIPINTLCFSVLGSKPPHPP
jgi:hydrogenase expression/formation protein HypD